MKPVPAAFFREVHREDRIVATAAMMVIAALLCAFLHFGKDVLVPVALAVLFAFLQVPAVKGLQKRGFPKTLAIGVVAAFVLTAITVAGLMISWQAASLTQNLPAYESNLKQKIAGLKYMSADGSLFGGAGGMLGRLGAELEGAGQTSAGKAPLREIIVMKPESGIIASYAEMLGPMLHPVMQGVLVAIFCAFFLFQREDMRDRLIRLAGRGDLLKSTAAINDAASKLSKLFLLQTLMNIGFGLFIGIALWLLGVPAAALCGLFAGLMRFVPYVGAAISAILPVILAAAVSPDWTLPLMVIALFALSEPIIGQVVEPLLYGHSAGLSPVAVIAAAGFWTLIWGPVGLLLATPLTILLTVIGRHVEGFQFLDTLLGSEPALTASQTFYQRLLARDRHDAAAIAERAISETSMSGFLAEVAVPALKLADDDREQKRLQPAEQTAIAVEFAEVIEDVFVPDGDVEGSRSSGKALIVPAPGGINFAAAVALSASFSAIGIPHRMLGEDAASPLAPVDYDAETAKVAILVWLAEPAAERSAFMLRRCKAKFGALPLLTASWYASGKSDGAARPHAGVADLVKARIGL